MKFNAQIEIRGINPYVLVTADIAEALAAGWKKPMPVLVQVNGKPDPAWRINMMPVGDGDFYLYLAGQVRGPAKVEVGDRVEVSLAFDAEYSGGPQHDVPPALAAHLEQDAAIRARWEALTPSLRKEVLRYLAGLKSDAARQRNIDQAVRVLGGARERFMARDWN